MARAGGRELSDIASTCFIDFDKRQERSLKSVPVTAHSRS